MFLLGGILISLIYANMIWLKKKFCEKERPPDAHHNSEVSQLVTTTILVKEQITSS